MGGGQWMELTLEFGTCGVEPHPYLEAEPNTPTTYLFPPGRHLGHCSV